MSTEIDDRIVRMQLNNENFEKNAAQSISTLDKLQRALSFKNSYEGLTTLNKVISNVNFNPLESGIEKITVGFDKLETIGISVINNLTNKVVNFATNTLKNLTIGQVTAAWGKYEDKIQSVQTIMASTGKKIEEVNKELEELMWFTDETSYSFTDMTNNISKFTGAGVDLHDASVAMQGISTWAAITGNNTQGAARAMYNLSQAMSAGALLRTDFRSLEMVNMTTLEFKNTALETAAALGTLNKSADGVYTTLKKGTVVTAEGMAETLSERWFTADVLTKTLEKYGGFASKLYEYTEKYDRSATDFMIAISNYKNGTKDISKIAKDLGVDVKTATSLMNELTSSTYDLGYRAFKASQEAKTFTDVLSTLRDAVSTKWMDIFEQIFGNYEEAAELWTTVANTLYDVFTMGLDERRDLLKAWKEAGGRDELFGAINTIYNNIVSIVSTIHEGFREIFPKETVADLLIFSHAIKLIGDRLIPTEKQLERFKNIGRGIGSILNILNNSVLALLLSLKPMISLFGGIFITILNKVLNTLSSIGTKFSNFSTYLINSGFYDNIERIILAFNELLMLDIWAEFKKISPVIQKLKDSFFDLKNAVIELLNPITSKFSKIFMSTFGDATEIAAKGISKIIPIISKLFNIIQNGINILTGIIKRVTNIINIINEFNILSRLYNIIKQLTVNIVKKAINSIKTALEKIAIDFFGIGENGAEGFALGFFNKKDEVFKKIREFFDGIIEYAKEILGVHSPSTVFSKIAEYVVKGFELGLQGFTGILNFIKKILENIIKTSLTLIIDSLGFLTSIVPTAIRYINIILASILNGLDVNPLINFLFKIGKELTVSILDLVTIIIDGITKSLPKITMIANNIIDIIVRILLGLNLSKLTKTISSLIGSIDDTIKKTFSLGEKQNESILDKFKLFAVSIAILSASMFVLSKIDAEGGRRAVGIIITTMAGVVSAIKILNSIGRTKTSATGLIPYNGKASRFLPSLNGKLDNPFVQMMFIAASISIVASSLSKLAKRDPSKQFASALTIIAVCNLLIASVKSLKTVDQMQLINVAATLNSIISLVSVVSTAVVILSLINPKKIFTGILEITAIFASIELLILGLVGLSKLANNGTSALTGSLTNPLNEITKILKTIAGMTAVMAMVAIALGKNDVGTIIKGIGGIGGIFTAILGLVAGLVLISKATSSGFSTDSLTKLIPILLSITLVTTILSSVVKLFANMELGSLVQGLIALVGVLSMLSVVTLIIAKIASGTGTDDAIKIVAIMAAISLAVLSISNAINVLGNTQNKMAAIVTLAAALGLLVGVGFLIKRLGLGLIMIEIAAACAGVGIAAAGIGIGIKAAVEAVILFASSLDILIAAIPKFAEFISTLLLTAINNITEMIPNFVEAGWNLIITFINTMANSFREHVNELLSAIGSLLGAIGNFFSENWPTIKKWAWDIVKRINDGIRERIGSLRETAKDFIQGFIDGIRERINERWKEMTGWASDLISSVRSTFDEHSPSKVMKEIGMYLIIGFVDGIKGQTKSVSKQINETFVNPIRTAMDEVKELVNNTAKTMTVGADTMKNSFKNLGGILEQFAKKSKSNLSGTLYKDLYKQTKEYKNYNKELSDANKKLNTLKTKQHDNLTDINKIDKKYSDKTVKQLENEISEKEKELSRLKTKKTVTSTYTVKSKEKTVTEKVDPRTIASLKQEQNNKENLSKLYNDIFNSTTTSELNKNKDKLNKITKKSFFGTEKTYDLQNGTVSYTKKGDFTETKTKTTTTTVGSQKEIEALEKELENLKEIKKLKEDQKDIDNDILKTQEKINKLNEKNQNAYKKFINEQNKKYGKNTIEAVAILDKAISENATKRYKKTDAYQTYKENLKAQNKAIDKYNDQITKITDKAKNIDKKFTKKSKKDYDKELKTLEKQLKSKENEINKAEKSNDKNKIKRLKEERSNINKQITSVKKLIEYKNNIKDINKNINDAEKEIKNLNKQSENDIASVWDEYVNSISEAMKETTNLVGRTFDGISDITAKFEKGERMSINRLIKNYKSQNNAKAEYQMMLGTIQTKIDPGFYEYIKSLGIDGYNIVEAIYKASDAQIEELNSEYIKGLNIDYTTLKKNTIDDQMRAAEFANIITALYGFGDLINNDLIEELSKLGVEGFDMARMLLDDAIAGNTKSIKEINTLYKNSQNIPVNAANTIAAMQAVVKETGISDYIQNEGVIIANAIDTSKLATTATNINKKFSTYAANNTAKKQTNTVRNNSSVITNNNNNTSNNYNQYIYSPKALNNSEIYRQTHNLVSANN